MAAAGNGSAAAKRRNGSANGKNGSNGNGATGNGSSRAAQTVDHLDESAIKHELLRRPARPANGIAAPKTNGKAGKKA